MIKLTPGKGEAVELATLLANSPRPTDPKAAASVEKWIKRLSAPK